MISAATVFCEDIREEVGGSVTIVGVLPDNIGVPSVPGALSRLAIYTRIAMRSDSEPGAMQVLLRGPDGEERVLGEFARDFVAESCKGAQERENPIAGFVSIALTAPFPIKELGRFLTIVRFGPTELIAGGVNFEISREDAPSRSVTP